MNRWTVERANAWYAKQPWRVGCNFIPSNAINQLEMWQAESFDSATLDRELGWAAGLGMNLVRVYLHDVAWEVDPAGFKQRMNRFLALAAGHGIGVLFVIFDDCWMPTAQLGRQPAPRPGVHNSGWLQSPGVRVVNTPAEWGRLERYVRDVVGSFGQDARVVMWDLYNEPGNSGQDDKSLPLLQAVYGWARASAPTQPLTAGVWFPNAALNAYQLEAADVITFHNYNDAANLAEQIAALRVHGRPLICTEWLRRDISEVATCLPVFQRERVGCCNWGLVAGKTNTIFPWGSPEGAPAPARWFHDLLHADGTPFDVNEVACFRALTGRG